MEIPSPRFVPAERTSAKFIKLRVQGTIGIHGAIDNALGRGTRRNRQRSRRDRHMKYSRDAEKKSDTFGAQIIYNAGSIPNLW
jgi:hypothetical protein